MGLARTLYGLGEHMINSLTDGKGVPFRRYPALLPRKAADRGVTDRRTDLRVRREYAKQHEHCLICGSAFADGFLTGRNVHHLIGGTPGRSDELTNLVALCGRCHEDATRGRLGLQHVLYAKWRNEPETVDWVRLHMLRGRSLPKPALSVTLSGRTQPCGYCGTVYEYRRSTSRYCSTRCRMAAGRKRVRDE